MMPVSTNTRGHGSLSILTTSLLALSVFLSPATAFRHHKQSYGGGEGRLGGGKSDAFDLGRPNHNFTALNHTSKLFDSYPSLIKRAPVDFDRYVCKGNKALEMIAKDAPATEVWTREKFAQSGWSTYNDASSVSAELLPLLDGLGVPHASSDIKPVFADNYHDFKDSKGQTVPATKGMYHNKYIPGPKGKGAIISEANFSPAFEREMAKSTAEIPPLHRWSDVVWLLWSESAGDQKANLRYIFRDKVRNDATRAIIEKIHGLEAKPDTLDLPWPGHTYDMRTDDGKALLGSPQGIGVAYLIKDHSDVIGRKIPFAHVFSVSNRPPSLSGSEGGGSSDSESSESESSSSGSSSSESGSTSSSASSGRPVYSWDYYIVWELRDTARG